MIPGPTYGGLPIFGWSAKIDTSQVKRSVQTNEFFGLTGVEEIDGGGRGGTSTATGIVFGGDYPSYRAAWSAATSMQDGQARDLLSTDGNLYNQVKLVSWRPASELRQTAGGLWMRRYSAEFRHLI